MITTLAELEGEVLNAVCFVMDYVEFHFNGPILRALVSPVITASGKEMIFPEPGSRDALCTLIGAEVLHVEVVEEDAIRLLLSEDRMLMIPLTLSQSTGPEAAHFVPGRNQPLQVW